MKRLVIALLLSAGAVSVAAESLQVEVVVFDRGHRSGPETYPKRLDLSWPKQFYVLDTQPAAAVDVDTADIDTAEFEPALQIEPQVDWWPALAPESLTLQDAADRLRRHFGGRLLLHSGWLLPPRGAVLVRSEQASGQRPHLMGYVAINRGRYLELDTNFWLADFEPNNLEPEEGWPLLPRWPGDVETAPDTDLPTTTSDDWNNPTIPVPSDREDPFDTPLFSAEPFRVVQVVQLRESRRLKIGELNYLDHPRLGVLIKVTEAPSGAAQ